jgi:hypothetical protein
VTSSYRLASLDLNANTLHTFFPPIEAEEPEAAEAGPGAVAAAVAAAAVDEPLAVAAGTARAAARAGVLEAPYRLIARRDERVSGLLLWFDAAFEGAPAEAGVEAAGGKFGGEEEEEARNAAAAPPPPQRRQLARLSTGPQAPPTHFQQVLLFL